MSACHRGVLGSLPVTGTLTPYRKALYLMHHAVAAQDAIVGLRRLLPVCDSVRVPLLPFLIVRPRRVEVDRGCCHGTKQK